MRDATNEKLSTKIFSQFAWDIAFVLPVVLLIMLEWRVAMSNPCSAVLLEWLCVQFGVMAFFGFIRLGRIPLLMGLKSSYTYFVYTIACWVTYYIILFGVFIWGNILFWTLIRAPECQATPTYDPKVLWAVMGVVLMINWLFVMIVLQIIFFCIMLYLAYKAVLQAVENLKNDFSAANVIREVLSTIGEGEL